jgi:hypothetical protein
MLWHIAAAECISVFGLPKQAVRRYIPSIPTSSGTALMRAHIVDQINGRPRKRPWVRSSQVAYRESRIESLRHSNYINLGFKTKVLPVNFESAPQLARDGHDVATSQHAEKAIKPLRNT